MSRSEPVALLGCPFCGGEATFSGSENAGYRVQCCDCGIKGGWGDYGYQALTAWNTRAPSALPDGWKLELTEAVRKLRNAFHKTRLTDDVYVDANALGDVLDYFRDMISASPPVQGGNGSSQSQPSRTAQEPPTEPLLFSGGCALGEDRCVCWSSHEICAYWRKLAPETQVVMEGVQ